MKNIYILFSKKKIKSLIIWTLILTVFMIAGMGKFSSISADPAAVDTMMAGFPETVKVFFGFGNQSISTLVGYVSMMMMYITIAVAIFAGMTGGKIISEEEDYKTSDYIFTKPISRTKIFLAKYLVGLQSVIALNILLGVIYFFYLKSFQGTIPHYWEIFLAQTVISIFILSLGAFFSALKRNKFAELLSALIVLIFFLEKILLELKAPNLNLLSPFYCLIGDQVTTSGISLAGVAIYLFISLLAVLGGIFLLNRRDIR